MKKILRTLKLMDDFKMELTIDKNEFVLNLKSHVDEKDIGIFSDTFDVFSSSKNVFKGHIGFHDFTIKRRRKFFDRSANWAVATGTFTQLDERVLIKAEINGFQKMFIPFYIIAILFYSFFLIFMLQGGIANGNSIIFIPFILVHASLMLGIPYFLMRKSVKHMKHELEREFFYMTKK